MSEMSQWTDVVQRFLVQMGPLMVKAVIVFILGLIAINGSSRLLDRVFEKRNFDPSLRTFLNSFFKIALKVMLVISVAGMVGIHTTSFVAVLGAAGLAVGLAFQGTLSNFAGSILLLTFRPYQVGDVIEVQGITGTVKSIQIFSTVLVTADNKTVIVPNGSIAGGTITNLSTQSVRRVDMTFGIGYGDDLKKAKSILENLLKSDERVLEDPMAVVVVKELADSAVLFAVRPWVKSEDYWPFYFDMQEKVKLTFDENKISIPFPQQDIHLYSMKGDV
ncbi:MAG: mechanosensitive ion channel protein MscS [Bdellovibrionaceae bacterium]|nr:mechanosensitive ion channel protein MscS [Pseudobdellovibrionaceae bacterium]|tara:strand:- start:1027 stop:1854 length:828 start_codon:yes stop_codon:yes gene_type:complete